MKKVICFFVIVITVTGCASRLKVPDAESAIAIGEKQCGSVHPKSWSAKLIGDKWTVRGKEPDIERGIYAEVIAEVKTDGVIIPGCGLAPKPGIEIVH